MADSSIRTIVRGERENLPAKGSALQNATGDGRPTVGQNSGYTGLLQGQDETRSDGTDLERHTGRRRGFSACPLAMANEEGSHRSDIMRMLVVVAVCALVVQGALAGLEHVCQTIKARRSVQSVHTEVVEEFSLPKVDQFTNFTSAIEHKFKDMNFKPDFKKPLNFTKTQFKKLQDVTGFPSFIDTQHEYYDSGKVVMGSWHWLSCDKDHLEKCNIGAVHGCCCKPGFAFVAENAGSPIAKGAAAGAAGGALITGVLLGSDVGASTASGAASGAVGGAVHYLLENGACEPKEHLSKSVQSHLS